MSDVTLEALKQQEAELQEKLEKADQDIQMVESAIGQFLAQNPYVEMQMPPDLIKALNARKNAKKNYTAQLEEIRRQMQAL